MVGKQINHVNNRVNRVVTCLASPAHNPCYDLTQEGLGLGLVQASDLHTKSNLEIQLQEIRFAVYHDNHSDLDRHHPLW